MSNPDDHFAFINMSMDYKRRNEDWIKLKSK